MSSPVPKVRRGPALRVIGANGCAAKHSASSRARWGHWIETSSVTTKVPTPVPPLTAAGLTPRPVDQLATFFGRMFSLDHKAGVMPAALALRHLAGMKHFKPDNSTGILSDICELGDDFHRQVPATRWEIYGLLEFLLCDDVVRMHLRAREGQLGTLMARFLQLCRHERDPRNLMTWFKLLRLFLHEYPNTASTVDDVFRAYSAYFPVSMRSSTAPSGVTVDDLKLALRGCFSASHLAAAGVFSFLVEKLDQGDAVSLSVKVRCSLPAFPVEMEADFPSSIY